MVCGDFDELLRKEAAAQEVSCAELIVDDVDWTGSRERQRQLMAALKQLPRDQAYALMMHNAGWDRQHIAEMLNLGVKGLEPKLKVAKEALAKILRWERLHGGFPIVCYGPASLSSFDCSLVELASLDCVSCSIFCQAVSG